MAVGAKGVRAGRAYVELGVQDKLARGLRRAQARLRAFGAGVKQIGLGLVKLGAIAMAPFLASAKVFSSMGDNIAKMAKRTGFSVEALSELTYVASQTGTELGDLEKVVRRMQRSIYDAERGLSTAVDGFADLGLTVKDFEGLKPEEQFKLMADRIGSVEDPTRKAAIAMTLLGRSGTAMLPMMAGGAAGIEELQKKARALGLTMSREDAVAAEGFTDAMDSLWKVVKMGAFNIGAALEPVLSQIAKTLTDVALKVSTWIKANRGLIVSVFKVVGLVIAGGAALAVLGTVISSVGSLFGVLATVVSTLGAVLGFVLSPIGLVTAAVAGLGAYLLFATETGAKWLGWLGDAFGSLKEDASKSFDGIKRAMKAGDMGLAAQILWLTLKKWWVKGTGWLLEKWLAAKNKMTEWATSGFYAIAKVWAKVVAKLKNLWAGFTKLMKIGKSAVQEGVSRWKTESAYGERYFAAQEKFKAGEMTKAELDTELTAAQAERDKAMGEHRADAEEREGVIRADHAAKLKEINEEEAAKLLDLSQRHIRQNAAQQNVTKRDLAALAARRKKVEEELAAALAKTPAGDGGLGGPPKPGDLDEIAERIRKAMGDLPGQLDRAQRGTARGTFGAAALQSLQTSGGALAQRTAEACERIAKNTKLLPRAKKLTFT